MLSKITKSTIATIMMLGAQQMVWADELTPQKRSDLTQLVQTVGAEQILQRLALEAMGGVNTSQTMQELGKSLGGAMGGEVGKAGAAILNQLPSDVVQQLPGAAANVMKGNMGAVVDKLVPIIGQKMNAPEVKQLLEYYRSQDGQKALQNLPAILQKKLDAKSLGQMAAQILMPSGGNASNNGLLNEQTAQILTDAIKGLAAQPNK